MTIQRVLRVKLELHLSKPEDKAMWKRLLELSWQAMRYGNLFLRARLQEAMDLRVDPSRGDAHDVTKRVRATEKMELSGAVYAAIEREAQGICTKHLKRALAGAPLPEFREGKSLSIRGHAVSMKESGVRLTFEAGQFYAHLSLQSATAEGGCWFKLPIAKNTAIDDYQAPLLHQMAAWAIPITKAALRFQKERGRAILYLTYKLDIELPAVGDRVATLGPISSGNGRGPTLFLRTELENRDYSGKLYQIEQIKRDWDGTRRRVLRAIGRGKKHARTKRFVLAHQTPEERIETLLHQWSHDAIAWLYSQGIGHLTIAPLSGMDWPAYRFIQQLKYKGTEIGIQVTEDTDTLDASTRRSMKQEAQRERRRSRKFTESINEITHQIGE